MVLGLRGLGTRHAVTETIRDTGDSSKVALKHYFGLEGLGV